jgi:hypothetical protein
MKPVTLAFAITLHLAVAQLEDSSVRYLRSQNMHFDPKTVQHKVSSVDSLENNQHRNIAAKSSAMIRIDQDQIQGSEKGVFEIISTDQSHAPPEETSVVHDSILPEGMFQTTSMGLEIGVENVNHEFSATDVSSFEIIENRNSGYISHVVIRPPAKDASCKISKTGHAVAHGGKCDSFSLGNTLAGIYMSALRAFQRNNTFSFVCNNKRINRDNEVLKTYVSGQVWNMTISDRIPDLCQESEPWPHRCRLGLNYAVPIIRKTLQQIPPPPDLDDVTIHLRCGDILGNVYMRDYGYPRYSVYKEFLTAPFGSIGILTATHDPRKARSSDVKHFAACSAILDDMVHFFEETYPSVKISIRSSDTIAQSFGRMIHSKQFWCNPSSFCVFPAIATTGHSYMLQSELYPFVEEINGEPNIQVVKRGFLNATQIAIDRMNVSEILTWLRMP